MRKLQRRAPGAALVVSLVALTVAMVGTGYAAFVVPPNSVGAKQLVDGAATRAKLADGAVTTAKIADGAVTAAKINATGLTVPAAHRAGRASIATRAAQAANAAKLAGSPAADYLSYGGALPSGKTESGDWGSAITASAAGAGWRAVTSFVAPLRVVPTAEYVVGLAAPHCPGAGRAARGYLCLYQGFTADAQTPTSSNVFNPETGFGGQGSRRGFAIYLSAARRGVATVMGSYAVTAP